MPLLVLLQRSHPFGTLPQGPQSYLCQDRSYQCHSQKGIRTCYIFDRQAEKTWKRDLEYHAQHAENKVWNARHRPKFTKCSPFYGKLNKKSMAFSLAL